MTDSLTGDDIYEIDGILNGTTNYILTQMEKAGKTYEEALVEAQRLGYAEKDPTADVDGHDSCRKICILAALAFGKLIPSDMVSCTGIRNITQEDILKAKEKDSIIRLIARAVRTDDGIFLEVAPMAVRNGNPLASVEDVFNGILVRGNISGDLMFYGRGAGSLPTAGAVVSDIIDILTHIPNQPKQQMWTRSPESYVKSLPAEFQASAQLNLGVPVEK